MKIILFAVAYPPDPHVGALRAEKVARALGAAGHQVHVITARLAGEATSTRSADRGVTVHAVRSIPNPRHALLWLRNRFRRPSDSRRSPSASAAEGASKEKTRSFKGLLLALLHLPDEHQGFVLPALRCARRTARDADLVYTTTPPHSTHVIGLVLQRWWKIRWVAEFRDPWYVRSPYRLVHRAERILRSACLNRFDQAVAVSEGTRDSLLQDMERPSDRQVVLARNGIQFLAHSGNSRIPLRPIRIAYVGTLYLGRDPRPFLRALAALRRRNSWTPEDVQVDLVGWCDAFRGIPLHQVVEELGIADLIRFHGLVSHERATEYLADAHLLLLLAQGRPLQVPNKLYEYLGTRKPIFAFVDEHGESARMLNQAGGHYLVTDEDPEKVERALDAALAAIRAGRSLDVDEAVLEAWTTVRQMDHLLHMLGLAGTPAMSGIESS